MKLKHWMLWAALVLVAAFTFSACGGGAQAPASGNGASTGTGAAGEADKSGWVKLNLSFATYLPMTDSAELMFKYIVDGLEKYVGEEYVTINYYPNSTLLGQEAMLDGLRSGTADIGFVDIPFFQQDFPVCNLWVQPGMGVTSTAGGTAAFTEWAQTNQNKYEEFDSLVFLSGQNNGPCTWLTKFKINAINDLSGKQLRSTPTLSRTLQAFGVNPVNLPIGEMYEALRTGLVEGEYASFGGMVAMGYGDFAKNALAMSVNSEVYGFFMNRNVFNTMPPSQQEAFMAGWNEGFWEGMLPNWEQMQILSVQLILDGAKNVDGWQIAAPGSEFDKQFRDISAPVLEAYMRELDGMGYDAEAIKAEIQAEQEKWTDGWWGFDREFEPYVAMAEGTYDEWVNHYSIPQPIPEHNEFKLSN
jgi:TRAP-type C4-dicarboxylate transport system substrate-binding protein